MLRFLVLCFVYMGLVQEVTAEALPSNTEPETIQCTGWIHDKFTGERLWIGYPYASQIDKALVVVPMQELVLDQYSFKFPMAATDNFVINLSRFFGSGPNLPEELNIEVLQSLKPITAFSKGESSVLIKNHDSRFGYKNGDYSGSPRLALAIGTLQSTGRTGLQYIGPSLDISIACRNRGKIAPPPPTPTPTPEPSPSPALEN